MPEYEDITYEIDKAAAVITINRPSPSATTRSAARQWRN